MVKPVEIMNIIKLVVIMAYIMARVNFAEILDIVKQAERKFFNSLGILLPLLG